MDTGTQIEKLVIKSRQAQEKFEAYDQQQVDKVVYIIAKTVYENAQILARMAVDETGMGVYEDKVKKNKAKAGIIYNSLRGKKSVGVIHEDKENAIIEVAKPKGVIAAVTPCTNPIVTPMCNAMFSVKGRNSIIIAPHPRAKKCSSYTVDLINEALGKADVAGDLIQIIREPSIELTNELMKACDTVVATGGMAMVKAAYSSGKPAYGVGSGNVQCVIDRGCDIKEAVSKIITGRTFDNGIICSGEQSVMIPEEIYDRVIKEFENQNAYYCHEISEKQRLRDALFPSGIMNKELVGQSAAFVAMRSDIKINDGTRMIIVEADNELNDEVFAKEKMCPVIAAYRYKGFHEAVSIAQKNLDIEGKGHSASIHSNNDTNILYMMENLKISRLVVNQPASTTLGGSFNNGFAPTTTLGCGSWGNNSISENLNYTHLINITRVGYFNKNACVPSENESEFEN